MICEGRWCVFKKVENVKTQTRLQSDRARETNDEMVRETNDETKRRKGTMNDARARNNTMEQGMNSEEARR
jgi:hypothetical protein